MASNSIRVVVGSKNIVKINAARDAFARCFSGREIAAEGCSAPSDVADQPMSDDETLRGATNRARNARQAVPGADFYVGLEGGCENTGDGSMQGFAWMVVLAGDVRDGVELGKADDIVFSRHNSKSTNGAVGILTHDIITRTTYYEHAVILALTPFMNEKLFFEAEKAE